jgi:membrane protease YdiL (CAAX protease family)
MLDDFSKQVFWKIKWWQALSFCVSAYLLSILISGIFSNLVGSESTLELGLLYAISSSILLACSWIFLKIKKIKLDDFLGKLTPKQLVYIPIYYVVYVVLSRMAQTIIGLIPNVDVNQSQDFGMQSNSVFQLLVIFFSLVILPAICEEIVFRGLLYRSFRKPFGKILAAIFISLLFGAAHGQWNVAADTFVLSLVLIYLVEKNNSLWPSISLHFLKNLVAFLLVFVFKVS